MTRIARFLRRFAGGTEGSVIIEGVIMFPVVAWCFVACYSFFDAFHARANNIRAAFTISDTLTRETDYITPAYMDGLLQLQRFLMIGSDNARLRITVFHYDDDRDRLELDWSQGRGGYAALTSRQLRDMADSIPTLAPGDSAILVETESDYEVPFKVGLADDTFYEFVVARPRFSGQLCWNPVEDGANDTAVC
ncbi:TadE/TadG family type IV pilus assembly protein [Pseudoroseicyclus sp. CXY001]|uniref:TadE/TadG family type IV pilus assembly protein n=1 Tax=Pseudoroseicyclus sp. CXY001 TaxID=3242492 RepID=UPI003570D734